MHCVRTLPYCFFYWAAPRQPVVFRLVKVRYRWKSLAVKKHPSYGLSKIEKVTEPPLSPKLLHKRRFRWLIFSISLYIPLMQPNNKSRGVTSTAWLSRPLGFRRTAQQWNTYSQYISCATASIWLNVEWRQVIGKIHIRAKKMLKNWRIFGTCTIAFGWLLAPLCSRDVIYFRSEFNKIGGNVQNNYVFFSIS